MLKPELEREEAMKLLETACMLCTLAIAILMMYIGVEMKSVYLVP